MTEIDRKNRRVVLILTALVFGMVGVSFAAVPLYDLFCRVTGYGGTTQVADDYSDVVLDRTVKVRFNGVVNPNLPWDFSPEANEMEVHLGQTGLISYSAKNNGDHPIVGTAIYNVSPPKAGLYFQKVQCFCFENQILMPNQEMQMPISFFVDPAMDEDSNLDDVKLITLSYTFYPAKSQEFDQARSDYFKQIEAINGEGADQAPPSIIQE